MNSSYFNMISSAFLGAVFVVLTISFVSEGLFHSEAPEQEGFVIEVANAPAAGPAGGGEAELAPISPLLASADIEAGAKVFKKCAACHTADEGGANKVGPALWDIVNRPAGGADGFGYSAPMKEYGAEGSKPWEYENLNKFLLKPKAYIKGTSMGFAGLKKEKDRANVIAYLRSLSTNPAPLP
jgi:cytochrome c